MVTRFRAAIAGLLAAASLALPAQAGPFSGLTVFGDSLTDTGNVLSLTTAVLGVPFPSFPAEPGRFSNGPTWVEGFAAGLGLSADAQPSNLILGSGGVVAMGPLGGSNFSFGAARVGLDGTAGPTTGIIGQLIAWNGGVFSGSLTRAADPNAIYVISAGANDMRDTRSAAPGNTAADAATRQTQADNAARFVAGTVSLLAQAGARHFLVSNIPDLGQTPEAAALGLVDASTDASIRFNNALTNRLTTLDGLFLTSFGIDLDLQILDLYGLGTAIVQDATTNGGAVYGITNVDAPCIDPGFGTLYFFAGSTDVNCGVSLYSDDLHPTARAHALLAGIALVQVGAVPLPGTLLLLATGIAGLLLTRRRA